MFWVWETLLGKGANLAFLWWTCLFHMTSRAALHCTNFNAKTFSTGKKLHARTFFLYIWKTIYHEGIYPLWCNPAHLQYQHPSTADGLSFSLGDNNPPSITQVQTPMSPHLTHPSPPLPLQVTVIKSFIRQGCQRYSNCSVTGAAGCRWGRLRCWERVNPVPHHRTWMSVHQPRSLTWVYALCFSTVTKKPSQINWGRLFWEREKAEGVRWTDTHLILAKLLCRLVDGQRRPSSVSCSRLSQRMWR